MSLFSKVSLSAVSLLIVASAVTTANATTAPSDPCLLLTVGDISTATGRTYGVPVATVAPNPYPNSGKGTDCRYHGDGGSLLFRIYFDSSSEVATGLFNQLKMFFPPESSPSGPWDDAYFDRQNGLHVRKGNVRFFLSGHPSNPQLQAFAALIVGRL